MREVLTFTHSLPPRLMRTLANDRGAISNDTISFDDGNNDLVLAYSARLGLIERQYWRR